jgi:hypothetical protein
MRSGSCLDAGHAWAARSRFLDMSSILSGVILGSALDGGEESGRVFLLTGH